MSPRWTAALFPGGDPLVYVSAIAGKRWATQWSVYRGVGADGLHAIEFLVEIDPAAAGGGGSLLRQRARLWCTDTLDPVRYVTEAQGARLTLRFAADRVTAELPDQSVQAIPRDGAAFVVDGSFPGQAALVYAESAHRMADAPVTRMHLFVASQLVTVPIEIVPIEIAPGADLDARNGRWYRTSHREEVMLDPDGLMVEVTVPHLALACRLDRPGPPLPDWPDGPPPAAPSLSYAPPETTRFRLEDVQVPGPVTPIGATLSVPAGAGPFPGVLFLGGSGIHDRHGIAGEIDLGTHEIVDGLAEHGFVGLRFDSRGAGTTRLGSDALDRGLASDIADARACLAFLRARPETAGQKLFLIGHSQGGMEALALAGEADTATALAGIVLMATPGRDIDAMIADQVIAHGETVGFTREQVDRQLDDLAEATRLVRSGQPWRAGQIPDYLLALFRTRTWYEEMLRYRTPDLIARLRCPVLVCQGGKDFQVSPARDAEALVAAARAAGVACSYELFPDLDHLFKHSSGPSTLAAYYEPRPVDPAFQACLRAWLRRHAGPPAE